jgi:ABC-type phosphate transport system substrate-binding protein
VTFGRSRTCALLLLAATALAGGEARLVVVVNPESGVATITRDEARDIFLGRQKRLASGIPAQPVEQADPAEVRSGFYFILTRKALPEINAYWARLLFTGQAHPPRQARSAEEVIRAVAADKGAIGLLQWSEPDRRVKVVLALDPKEGL